MSGLLRFLAAGFLAIAALGGSCLAHAAEIRVVGLSFIPNTIRLDATSTLRFDLRNNGAGGQRLSVDYSLGIPAGLNVVGAPRLGDNCIASAVQVTASVGSGSVNLIGLTLLPSGTCTIDVTVSAAQTGTYTATEAGNGSSILSATLTVLVPTFAQVNVSQTSVPFPPQEVGIVSAAKVVTVTNSGGGMLDITGITASGDFSPTQCSPATSLPSGGTCTFSIVFIPTMMGAQEGLVQISSNVGSTSIVVSGEGVAPLPAMSPSPLALGTVTVNTSATANVTLTNSSSGTAALTITNIAIISGAFFSRSHNCPGLLGVDESCTIVVTYAPTSTGEHAGQLKVESNTLANARVLTLSGTAIVTAPGAPLIGTATAGNAQATITFTPPASNGGSPITLYTVTSNPGGITATGTGSPITITGLTNGTAYTFTVTAANAFATGPASAASNSVTPKSVPGAPLIGTATAGNAQATVTFTPPASNGGSPITGYTVTSNPGGITATGTSSPITVTGLANGTAYSFTVAAANAFGTGPVSGASNSVTPMSVPGAPVIGTATAGNAQATVAFSPPASNGGSAITTYTVTSNPGGIMSTGAASPITLGGLSNGTAYTFTATATNAVGTGSPSASSNSVTPATVPGAPTAVSAAAGNGQATVSFTPPASNGGSPITSYTVTSSPGGITATGSASPIAVTGLANSTAYTFTVTATNAVGAGSPSAASNSVTLKVSATLTPAPASFGSVVVDSSATLDVTLTSTGTSTLSLSSISLSASLFFTQTNTCMGSLAPNTSCVITIKYAPTATGNHTAQLTVSSNAAGSPHVVAISGTGIAPGVSLTPTPVNFANVPVGTSASSTLSLTNTGTAPLSVISITASGTGFTQSNTCLSSLAPGASCPIDVNFAPTAAGSHSGQLSVLTNVGTSPLIAPLSGVGAVPAVSLSAASLDFGSQTIDTQSSTQSVTVTNTGTAPLAIATITAMGDYSFLGCVTPVTLVPGASCTLSVKFLPTAAGLRAGVIAIASNAAGSPHSITLAGNGTPAPVPGIAVAPTSVEFGAIIAGSSIVTHVALTNTGTAPLAIVAISTSAAAFTQTNTCPASLAPSAACDISITYAPGVAGSHSGELHVVSNAVPSPLVVPLAGSSLPVSTPLLQLSSTSVVFGPQFVNVASSPKAVTLLNGGLAPLQIAGITSTGDFGYSGCGFPATLLPGQSCTFSITFKPLSVGTLLGAIEIASDAPGGPHTITLSGKGASFAVPEISLSPSHLAFEPQPLGAVATQRMGLRNAGASVLEILNIRASGAHFSQGNDCPAALAVGAGCEIVVTYAPTAIGAHGGHIVIESNAVPSPHAAPLSGTGIAVPPPFLAVDRLVDFGQQVVGTTAREGLRLTNTGGHPVAITAARILGGSEFGVAPGCASVAPAASCVLELTFTPTAVREFAARLDIVSNHSAGVVQVDLAGAGVPKALPDLELSVAGLGWGNQTVGTLGEERIVKLTSIGGEALRINAITASPDFVVDAGQCPALLDPKRSCEVRVNFRPLVPGPRQGRLTIDSNATGEPDSVSLTGIGCRLFAMGAARNPSRLCSP